MTRPIPYRNGSGTSQTDFDISIQPAAPDRGSRTGRGCCSAGYFKPFRGSFTPPGNGASSVPLKLIKFKWGGAVNWVGGQWIQDPKHPFYQDLNVNGDEWTEMPVWSENHKPN